MTTTTPYIIVLAENDRDVLIVSQHPLSVRYLEATDKTTNFTVWFMPATGLVTIEHIIETLTMKRGFTERTLSEQEMKQVLVNAIFRAVKNGMEILDAAY